MTTKKTISVPSEIQFGLSTFKTVVKAHEPTEGLEDFGGLDLFAQEMTIYKSTPEGERISTMHEVVHGILWTSGAHMLFQDEGEESFVSIFAEPLLRFIRENPDLLNYLEAE